MPTYIVTEKATGLEKYRYSAAEPIDWVGFEFATHDHTPEPDPVEPEVPAPANQITKLAFRSRFTAVERATITFAARQNTVNGAAVQSYLDDVQAATFIDLNRQDTRAGVQGLEAAGLIAAGRATEILDTPATELEAYLG